MTDADIGQTQERRSGDVMWVLLRGRFVDVFKAVAPLVGMICVLQVAIVRAPADLFLTFLAGSVLTVVGMTLLFVGIDLGVLPMGRFVGAEMPKKGSIALVVAVTFALAFATTVAEPDVLVLAGQVDALAGAPSGHAALILIALGVALFAAMAIVRIVLGWSMRVMLTIAYGLVVVLSLVSPAEIVPLAFDAGSVTTGVLSAPVLIALAMGMSSVLAGRSAVSDGFGLLGFASVGPIIVVLLMGMARP
ncbi:DUF1538 domain-containing protein [Ancylobacter sp. VNQ12]|uniref:DUF1538 domain-containing protein n=1 Tax=Ancylobacter sp. VNQ12 TaxID=3400920 RepID=UPI003C0BCE30